MSEEDKNREKFKKSYLRLCKDLEKLNNPKEESEFDLGIDFEEEESLTIEEEQKLDKLFDDAVDEIASFLFNLEDCEEEDED